MGLPTRFSEEAIKGIKGFSLTSIYKHNNFCFLAFKIKDRGNVNYPTVC